VSVRRRGDRWTYRKRVQLPDGRHVRVAGSPSINTQRAAEQAERAHIERVLNPPKVQLERRKMSDVFDRFLDEHDVNANNKESTRASKKTVIERHLRPHLGRKYLDEIDAAVIATLTATLHKTPSGKVSAEEKASGKIPTLGPKTVKEILQTLARCLRWTHELGWVESIPKVRMPKVDQAEIRFLDDAELAALLEKAAAEPMWFCAVVLAVDAGLRRGELRALKWTDVNEVTNRIVVSRAMWRRVEGSPKSRKPRSIPMTQRLRAALAANKATKLRGPYVLSTAAGGAFGDEHMHDTISRLARVTKLTDCAWHTLRHTFCTRLAMRGVPARSIQELAGHASITTTMRYMHVVPGATDVAIAALDAADAGRAQGGHSEKGEGEKAAEAAAVIPFFLVTPSGFEPEFSA
jgi:integrase